MTIPTLATLNLKESIVASKLLAKMVEERDFRPDCVLGIARGGLLPAYEISQYFGCDLKILRVERPLTGLKRFLFLDHLPTTVKVFLRKMEMRIGLYRSLENRRISSSCSFDPNQKYLVVDDSLDTGKTVGSTLDHLYEDGVVIENVLVVALTQIFRDADPSAACTVYRDMNICFPWSNDSIENKKFKDYCLARPLLQHHL